MYGYTYISIHACTYDQINMYICTYIHTYTAKSQVMRKAAAATYKAVEEAKTKASQVKLPPNTGQSVKKSFYDNPFARYVRMYVYIYVYMYVCVCECVYVFCPSQFCVFLFV